MPLSVALDLSRVFNTCQSSSCAIPDEHASYPFDIGLCCFTFGNNLDYWLLAQEPSKKSLAQISQDTDNHPLPVREGHDRPTEKRAKSGLNFGDPMHTDFWRTVRPCKDLSQFPRSYSF